MAKKQKETAAPTPTTPVASRDSLQRLSYLYQASIALSSILPTTNTSVRSAKAARSKGKGRATVRDPAPAQGGETTASGEADRGEGSSKALPERGPPLKRRRRREAGTSEALKPLSRHLAQEMVEVAKKATVRMDPSVKRTKCKGCGTVLIAGVTSQVRIKPSGPHGHLIVSTCLSCHTQRRLPAPPLLPPPLPPSVDAPPPPPATSIDIVPPFPVNATKGQPKKKSKREKREARQARPPVFFEREGHISIRGNEVVVRDEYREL